LELDLEKIKTDTRFISNYHQMTNTTKK